MEVSGLHPKLLLYVLLLLTDHCHSFNHTAEVVAAFPQIDPNRLQFFEYESIQLNCEGFPASNDWRVMQASSSRTTQWEHSKRSLNIYPAFASHSGEYWCENEEGEKSNTLSINITAGDVILESPTLPVMEQQTVTLRCKKRQSPKNFVADFYKDGHFKETGYKGTMTIHNVSSSDEGLYMCRSGAGESPESRLAVTGQCLLCKIPREETVYENTSADPSMMLYVNVPREENEKSHLVVMASGEGEEGGTKSEK
ncbi:low affinity immunoglobulin gamma Fc region receptor III-like [Cheilinus undulatus]|uniref:low affinity immunoglobulin gamma Fc region receptor III-like n=1 Tax=Cheilinus undulatus TaxID=241271 RepID=UPI001BD55AB1|nr:low affinity immunoglobulin gamma Fc region receptor III-like [Cheilinus undulatus]